MTSTLKVDELQNSLGGSDVKVGSLKHPDASGNNLVLGSDGTTTVSGAITASGGIKVADGGNIGSVSDPDAISISSGGLVIDSARPSFSVYGNQAGSGTDVSAGSRIPFNTEIYDRGSNWDTSNHYFTVPIAGVYYFTCQIYHYDGNNLISFEIKSEDSSDSDSVGLARVRVTPPGSDEMYFVQTIAYIVAGRRVSVRNTLSSSARKVYLQSPSTHSLFQGALIG